MQTWDSTQMTAGLEDTWGYVSWVGGNQEHVDAMVTNCLQQHTLPCKHPQAHMACSGHTPCVCLQELRHGDAATHGVGEALLELEVHGVTCTRFGAALGSLGFSTRQEGAGCHRA